MNVPTIDLNRLSGSVKKAKPAIEYAALKALCDGDKVLELCFDDFLDHALRYTETVTKFTQVLETLRDAPDPDLHVEIARIRGATHDSLISSVRILARNMGMHGRDNLWYDQISLHRAAIGRFALIISFEFLELQTKKEAK